MDYFWLILLDLAIKGFYKNVLRIQTSLLSVKSLDRNCEKDSQNDRHFETGAK